MSHIIPLYDWLYDRDISNNILLIYPRVVDKHNIMAMFVSAMSEYNMAVVTNDINGFSDSLNRNNNMWEDLELNHCYMMTYDDIGLIKEVLTNEEVDILLCDDIVMFSIIHRTINDVNILSKIIVLFTWGVHSTYIQYILKFIPNLRLLSLDGFTYDRTIAFNVIPTIMSEKQCSVYSNIKNTYNLRKELLNMITLYNYPNIEEVLTNVSGCAILPDKMDKWVDIETLNNLEEDGVKLQSLLDEIVSRWPQKQIIYTKYKWRYGVDLIISFLIAMHRYGKLPYEINEIYSISCITEYEVKINTLNNFNDAHTGVIVTNIVPMIPLRNITAIHLVDNYNYTILYYLLSKCPTHIPYEVELIVLTYVAQCQNDVTSDIEIYRQFNKEVKELDNLYYLLYERSNKIRYNTEHNELSVVL